MTTPVKPEILRGLTPRQQEVLHLILAGKTGNEIAEELGITIRTEERHRFDIYKRTGAKNTVDLCRKCWGIE